MENKKLDNNAAAEENQFNLPSQEEIEMANRVRGRIISKMTFDTINSRHPFREEIRELSHIYKINKDAKYSDVPLDVKAKVTKSYMDYKYEDYDYEIMLGKTLVEKILTYVKLDSVDQAKILKIIIDKYDLDIEEYFDDEVRNLKDKRLKNI